ncbi:uncharacterized protein A4U43_C04F19070 [Asparagus officinalis]|uniref:Peroxidase n=1 Tax=Asparagus officinalis TaxID=4686 RepID=A0A5P1F2L4_ASPOF|nr:uncharacterized protein A4U43_C04F19070 [Asparagus officinalis]
MVSKRDSWSILVTLILLQAYGSLLIAARAQVPTNRTLRLSGLVLHHYKVHNTCRYAEVFIKHLVTKAWNKDRSITPALLRLAYSDCMVTGCDASILLDGEGSEKEAPQNSGLRAFELIDGIKRVLEVYCPRAVSCADILQLAARDAAGLAGAPKYPVFTGRRDGFRSNLKLVDLPSPSVTWDEALAYFRSRGLDVLDLGTLLGTAGSRTSNESTVYLNPTSGSNNSFQSSYFDHVLKNRGVLRIDQQMITTMDGIRIANEFANGFEDFRRYFALGMARLGSLGVLTGKEGEIRNSCRRTNSGKVLK